MSTGSVYLLAAHHHSSGGSAYHAPGGLAVIVIAAVVVFLIVRVVSTRRRGLPSPVISSLRAAPCRDERRDRAGANRSPESFVKGLVLTLKGLTLGR
jgi:hypothetical protein